MRAMRVHAVEGVRVMTGAASAGGIIPPGDGIRLLGNYSPDNDHEAYIPASRTERGRRLFDETRRRLGMSE